MIVNDLLKMCKLPKRIRLVNVNNELDTCTAEQLYLLNIPNKQGILGANVTSVSPALKSTQSEAQCIYDAYIQIYYSI